ncbi:lysophospholipid acyltransferase family protein [Stappia stellulata]|uniref:lysophospholipid acyltransferase family protein n=1 Tax=Stappia stellulata TaxID=71235 RepID=UPI00146A3D6A|nr:lysophospholipid acyltransferase family protein [Stappia stellulata]
MWLAPLIARRLAPLSRFRCRRRIFARRIDFNLAELHPRAPLDAADLEAASRRWWTGAGEVLAEYATLERLRSAGRVEIEGWEEIRARLPIGMPVVFAAVHLGPFELVFEVVRNGLGRNIVATWQPEPSRHANEILSRLRGRYGCHIFPPGQRAARHLRRLVVGEGFDALLFVDEVRDRQIHLPAFGRDLPTRGNAVIAVKLALKTGAPLVPVHVLRIAPARYRFVASAPLDFDRDGAGSDPLACGVAALDCHFAPIVRANLEQWWMLSQVRLPDFVARPKRTARDQ